MHAIWLACAQPGAPVVVARGAGAGWWTPHTERAIRGALDLGLPALELDVGASRDHLPLVWSHEQVLDACVAMGGGSLPAGTVLGGGLDSYDAEALSHARCDLAPDPALVNAQRVEARPLPLAEILDWTRSSAHQHLELHLHVEGSSEVAAAIIEDWEAARLPYELVLSSADADLLRVLVGAARTAGVPYRATLRLHPERTAGSPAWPADLEERLTTAGADQPGLDWRVLTPSRRGRLARRGLAPLVLTVDDPDTLAEVLQWNVSAVLTSYPGEAPNSQP